DANSGLTTVVSARARPVRPVDVRVAWKKGFTGSRVERLPSYWASKRNDDAIVVSGKVQPHRFVAFFGEVAQYTWGPTQSSAEFLALDPKAIDKAGYYAGGQFAMPITSSTVVGVTLTREEISRDDSLIKYLAALHLYGVELGKKDRGTTVRFFATVKDTMTVGIYRADVSNPFPWVSGSWPVSGQRAFTGRPPDRYGLTVALKARLFP
ncbi:MAG TPA: hypothetical protein VEK56_03665, partial [Vicinamibacterales bacterium]|nr:hypothetical protein [Vicinamibacterales bacterium]